MNKFSIIKEREYIEKNLVKKNLFYLPCQLATVSHLRTIFPSSTPFNLTVNIILPPSEIDDHFMFVSRYLKTPFASNAISGR